MDAIEVSEVAELMALCKRMRKMAAAMMDGVKFIDKRVSDIEKTLRVVEFRQRYAEGVDDED